MQLESTLAQFPLPELIAMIVGSSVTGTLEVGTTHVACLYFRDGHLYHATALMHTGIAALCYVFTLKDALFRFTAGVVCGDETLWQSPWDLLDFAQRYATTWERVNQYIPSLDHVPVLCQTSAPTVQLSETGWKMLGAIDGQRSINAVAEQVGQVPLEIAAALCDLLDQGVVRMLPPPADPRPIVYQTPAPRGFFGRIMAAQPSDVSS